MGKSGESILSERRPHKKKIFKTCLWFAILERLRERSIGEVLGDDINYWVWKQQDGGTCVAHVPLFHWHQKSVDPKYTPIL